MKKQGLVLCMRVCAHECRRMWGQRCHISLELELQEVLSHQLQELLAELRSSAGAEMLLTAEPSIQQTALVFDKVSTHRFH